MVVLLITGCLITGPTPVNNETGVQPPEQVGPASSQSESDPINLELEQIPTEMVEATSSMPTQPQAKMSSLPNLGPAPELANEVWLNTSQPLRLADLRGKVVLIDMWTFG
jgi:hypothetical protein